MKALKQTGGVTLAILVENTSSFYPSDNTSKPNLSILFQFSFGCTKDENQVAVTWTVTA